MFAKLKRSYGVVLFIIFLICIFSSGIYAKVGENIALGKPYTFNEAPNYVNTTDAGDKYDLTDGKYTEGTLWQQKGAVGWRKISPVIITIDLQEIKSISGISYSTAAGMSSVYWPTEIAILMSDNGKDFYYVGDLIQLSLVNGLPEAVGYQNYRFKTCDLKTWGRYIQLVIVGQGSFTFSDEIEIYEGVTEFLKYPLGEKVGSYEEVIGGDSVLKGIKRRLMLDVTKLKEDIANANITEFSRQEFYFELEQIQGQLKNIPSPSENFKAIIPLNDQHENLFGLRAKLYREQGYPEIFLWRNNRWDMLTPFDPLGKVWGEPLALEIDMMRNEYRSEAFNITNFSTEPLIAKIKIEGLPYGDNPSYIDIHQVEYVDTRDAIAPAAALPFAKKVDDGYEITVPVGLTRQIWLTFNPPKTIDSGVYQGRIKVNIGEENHLVPLQLTLYRVEFPEQPTLSLGMWDYADRLAYGLTEHNVKAAIEDMNAHYVDTPWTNFYSTPWPTSAKKVENGFEMVIDYSKFDQWVATRAGSRNYAVYLNGQERVGTIGGEDFDELVGEWAKRWGQHIRSLGLEPSQFLLLLLDEPKNQAEVDIIVRWAQAIKKGEPAFKIFSDPVHEYPWALDSKLYEVSDVLCPPRTTYYFGGAETRDFYEDLRQSGKILWFYECRGPARALDPYNYYRLLAWEAWLRGAVGIGFWSYGDEYKSSWNEYENATSRVCYTPLYIDETSITTGKYWEAVREGIQDYEYFVILKDLIEELEKMGIEDTDLQPAKELLSEAPKRVVVAGDFEVPLKRYWKEQEERSVADQERVRILKTIDELLMLKR